MRDWGRRGYSRREFLRVETAETGPDALERIKGCLEGLRRMGRGLA